VFLSICGLDLGINVYWIENVLLVTSHKTKIFNCIYVIFSSILKINKYNNMKYFLQARNWNCVHDYIIQYCILYIILLKLEIIDLNMSKSQLHCRSHKENSNHK
jgi:hypothetical protein